jgi:hypothetical protein
VRRGELRVESDTILPSFFDLFAFGSARVPGTEFAVHRVRIVRGSVWLNILGGNCEKGAAQELPLKKELQHEY